MISLHVEIQVIFEVGIKLIAKIIVVEIVIIIIIVVLLVAEWVKMRMATCMPMTSSWSRGSVKVLDKNVVCCAQFLELSSSVLVSRILVGMRLERQLGVYGILSATLFASVG